MLYPLPEILLLCLCAVLGGADSWVEVVWPAYASAIVEDKDVKVTFLVPRALHERLKAVARKRRYPRAAMVRDGLRIILDREEASK